MTINDHSSLEITTAVLNMVTDHMRCLRDGKEIRINTEGVWCDCENEE